MNMDRYDIIRKTESFVKSVLQNAEGGHDWWHTHRVRTMALHLAKIEKADLYIVELAALLHDIADAKFNDGNEEAGPRKARELMHSLNVDEKIILQTENIIRNISFKSKGISDESKTIEFKVVQDADRLDAMGAIGIARAFNYGGYKNRPIYDPEIKPDLNLSKEDYKKSKAPTINHFYEKLLLLKDLMNTEPARKIADHRHEYMNKYLEEFFKEQNTAFDK
jgi:uncharacterized protein